MGKINAVRLINVNYNNNAIRINDETMHFNGESTLISLQNGGGKTVLVQMLTAPFVHKRYRNTEDRPFESFFTTAKPSFILVEWSLDGGVSRMMNGFMVRRNQNESEEQQDPLEITGIISEYSTPCMWDIHNLPVVEKTKKEMNLKGYMACRQLFEGYKKDREAKFFYYDMNNSAQQRQYFDKLKEYRVDYKEWEDIIKKINQKEGGLAELFSDCKDERSLTEKWFLESIEKKLDKEGSRIKEFERIVGNYVKQYYENEDKIKRRDTIEQFKGQVIFDNEVGGIRSIKSYAEEFLSGEEEKAVQESKIALFRESIAGFHADTEEEIARKGKELEELKEQLLHTRHEMYSYELLQLSKDKERYEAELVRLQTVIREIETKIRETEEQLGVFLCRKYYDVYLREKKEYSDILEKLRAAQAKGEDTRPRREQLGAILLSYYEEREEAVQEEIANLLSDLEEKQTLGKELGEQIKENARLISTKSIENGKLKTLVDGYSEKESEYNERYHMNLARNILGRYEEGLLDIEREKCNAERRKKEKDIRQNKERKVEKENSLRKNESDRNAAKMDSVRNDSVKEKAGEELDFLEQEIDRRKTIMQYVGLKEDAVFDTERIEGKLQEKIAEIEVVLQQQKEQQRKEKKEYDSISQGRIYELPEALKTAMEENGIHQIYGLEWLRKNGKNLQENVELVRRNPFLPYALILTAAEFQKLQDLEETVYSSLPVPVILRTDLEEGSFEVVNGTLELDKIRFYIRFNENLLDEEKMQAILKEKEEGLHHLAEKITVKEEERKEYLDKLGVIRNQRLSGQIYEEQKALIEHCIVEEKRLAELVSNLEKEVQVCRNEIQELENGIEQLENENRTLAEQQEKLEIIIREYDSYLEHMRERKRIEDEIENLQQTNDELRVRQDRIQEEILAIAGKRAKLGHELGDMEKEIQKYQRYREQAAGVELQDTDYKRIDNYVSEYKAITETIDADLKRLEENFEKQMERLQSAKKEYEKQKKKCSKETECTVEELDQRVHANVYDEDEENHLATQKKEYDAERKKQEKLVNETDKNISLQAQKMETKIAEMKKECGTDSVVPEAEIVPRGYEAEIHRFEYQQREVLRLKTELEEKRQEFSAILSGLAEYEAFQVAHEVSFDEDLSLMSKTLLDQTKGILVRDYNNLTESIRKVRNRLDGRLRDVLGMPEFQDDYYRKPLEAMLRLVDTPKEVLRQIDTTIRAYDDLMKKIEVDLSLIEKERTNIIGELMEYVKAVHADLDKIDENSTITVRERSLKMLDIKIPDWLENEELYNLRMRDFIDQLTERGVEQYKNNENASEYFGTQLNTKTLYDTVVGLNNIQIKLYKIEEQREYPITWSEVSRNSGGEGFLSTFVILSSLLHYIRKDDTDIFAERNESKVMIMDNPFGLTYSEHLLKPLMEVAKKNNTQMICLSGLGGDSIYGRFDNIYILNRVTANLKSGQQFLRMEHYRGADPETLVASQFEVMEQLTLF